MQDRARETAAEREGESSLAGGGSPPSSPLSEGDQAAGSVGSPHDGSSAGPDSSTVNADSPLSERGAHSTAVTPSGIEIAYFVEPKRKYEIRGPLHVQGEGGIKLAGQGKTEWHEVPSVSTIVDVLGKDALAWWGMRVGILGVLELFHRGILRASKLQDGQNVLAAPGIVSDGSAGLVVAGLEQVENLFKAEKLDTRNTTYRAADRGQSAHDALELWAENGQLPDPEMFPPEELGYIVGLRMFLEHLEAGEPEVVASERMVGSVEHGFAGRFDLEIRTHKPCTVVRRWMPKKGPQWATLEPGLYVPDLKTSKYVYESHYIQLEGYEIGRVDSGYDPSVARGVIHVGPGDPKEKKLPDSPYYEFAPAPKAAREAFLAALALHKALGEL